MSLATLREVLESLAYVAQIVAVGVLIYAARSYLLQHRQLNFDVITNCTQRFQEVLPGLYSDDADERKKSQSRYVDLCNEELFYFANGYLPPDIIKEWIDGMVLYLPHHKDDEWFPLPEDCDEPHRIGPDMLKRYSRITEIFGVDAHYDLKDPGRRSELVEKIYANVERRTQSI